MGEAQTKLQTLLNQLVAEGRERGVQLVVYHNGQRVIDAVAGVMDLQSQEPVDERTLFPVFSTTKGIAATLAHIFVERGKLSYDTRVADVWPEFAANGKETMLFRHLLNHTAGLQHVPVELNKDTIGDWNAAVSAMARAKPVTPPGAEIQYHAVTYGWLVGEVLRRVDGRPFGQMLQEEVCKPLGLKDLFVGLPAEFDSRVAILDETFEDGRGIPAPDDGVPRDVPRYMSPLHAWMNTIAARRACVPASNGICSAGDLAKMYAALVPGGVEGVELLPPSRVKLATQPTIPTNQPGDPKHFALGYGYGGDPMGIGSRSTAFGHGGYGGSMGSADPEQRLAVGYTKNYYSKAGAGGEIFRAVRAALGVPD